MLRLNVPEAAFAQQEVSLGGLTYKIVYKYNDWDERWRLDIYLGEALVIAGVKIMENTSLLGFRYSLADFTHGDLQCLKMLDDGQEVGRNNLGIGKAYELVYFSNEELDI